MEGKIKKHICKAVCRVGKRLTAGNVNSTCLVFSYQPILPKEALKLKKHE